MSRPTNAASGAMANLAAQGFPFLALIVVTPILLESLGREQYGVLILFNLVPQIAGQLDLGLATAATRGYARYSARSDSAGAMRLFHEALALLVAWGFVLGGIFYLFHASIADALKISASIPDGSPVYLFSAFAIPIALANGATLVPLRAVERYGLAARVQVIAGVGYWLACAFWATHGGSIVQLVALGTGFVVVSTIALFASVRRPAGAMVGPPSVTGSELEPSPEAMADPSPLLLRPFLRLGGGAFLAQASSLATYHADKLLVAALVSPGAAGAYAICTSIANKILLVVAAGATFTFPRSARMHAQGDHDAVARIFITTTRVAMSMATCIAVVLVALGPSFLQLWIGPSFAHDYGSTLRILTVGYALAACAVVASNVAVGIGEITLPALFAMTGGIVTLTAVCLLTPRHGVVGAAAAATIGMSQAAIFTDLVARRLGTKARAASWPLLGRLVLLAVPLVLASAAASTLIEGWGSLLLIATLTVVVFGAVWSSTFASVDERASLSQFLNRARHAFDHH